MTCVRLGQRFRAVGHCISREHGCLRLIVERIEIEAKLFCQRAVEIQQPRCAHDRRPLSDVEPRQFARERIVEGKRARRSEGRGEGSHGQVCHTALPAPAARCHESTVEGARPEVTTRIQSAGPRVYRNPAVTRCIESLLETLSSTQLRTPHIAGHCANGLKRKVPWLECRRRRWRQAG